MKRKATNSPPSAPAARGDAVRAAFEDALRRLAGQTPFEKLTVRGISRAAGHSTRTFYNRWKSKYDLVIRYYAEEDLAAIRAALAGGPLPTYGDLLRRAIRRLGRDRRMFLGAFRDMIGPESFAATFLDHACRSTPVYIRMRTGRDMPADLAPVLRHYYGGMLLVIAEWLASPAPVPPDRILRDLLAALPTPLRALLLAAEP
jgi:AcrR family transcriptional regulator